MAFDPAQYLADLTPPRTEMRDDIAVSTNELEVVHFAERFFAEGRAWQATLGLEELFNRALDALATKHFIDKRERNNRARTAANIFRSIIERKLSQVTDATPVFKVTSNSGNDWAADVSQDVMQSWWDEYSGQTFIDRVALQAMLGGSAPAFCTWDKSLDTWTGDLRMQCFPTKSVIVDPYLVEARMLQADALFVGVEIARPLSEFRLYYGQRGRRVKAQPGISHFTTAGAGGSGNTGIGTPYRRPANRGAQFANSAIPRATERRLYFRDLSLHPEMPYKPDGTPNLLFPRKRCIIYSWDHVLLADGDHGPWSGRFPLELFDWGMNIEHPYGESELESLWPLQRAIDLILSGVVHNARLQNEPPWMAEEGSIDPAELDDWEDYGDVPLRFHFFKQGRQPPKAIPPTMYSQSVMGTIEMLKQAMELVSGVPPVMSGRTEPSVTAGRAIQSLQQTAASTTRRTTHRLDDFLARYGQLVLGNIIQYYPDNRVLYLTKHEHAQEVLQVRQQFIDSLAQAPTEAEMERRLIFANRDLRLSVRPESGLGLAVAENIMFMERQAAAGRVEPAEVLRAARVSDPEEKVEKAQEFQAKQAMRMQQIKAVLGGGVPPGATTQAGPPTGPQRPQQQLPQGK